MSKFAKKNTTGNDALVMWANRICSSKGVEVKNIIKDWADGLAFCAIINFYEPTLLDYDSLDKTAGVENIKKAFDVLENKLDVETYLDAEDAGKEKKTMMMCLGKIYEHFHTEKYLEKNQISILTGGDSSPVTKPVTQSPVVKVTVKEVKPKTVVEPKPTKPVVEPKPTKEVKIEEPTKDTKPEEPTKVAEVSEKQLSPTKGSELEEMTKKFNELTQKYYDLQEKQSTMVYGSMNYVMIIIFLICLLVYGAH